MQYEGNIEKPIEAKIKPVGAIFCTKQLIIPQSAKIGFIFNFAFWFLQSQASSLRYRSFDRLRLAKVTNSNKFFCNMGKIDSLFFLLRRDQ